MNLFDNNFYKLVSSVYITKVGFLKYIFNSLKSLGQGKPGMVYKGLGIVYSQYVQRKVS
jgi:hypothetical protein